MCYCSKSADEGQGLSEKKRKGNQRGLGILPYGNFIIRTAGKYGEFRPCVQTWAVLAILPMTLPEGVSAFQYECLNLENKRLTSCSFNDKIHKTT